MNRIAPFLLCLSVIIQSGCIPKKGDALREHLVGTWDLTDHCNEYGTLTFNSDNTGSMWVNDECVVGSDCLNVLPFNWTLDKETGVVNVIYYAGGSALVICSSIEHTAPPSETAVITEETQVVFFYGNTFEHR